MKAAALANFQSATTDLFTHRSGRLSRDSGEELRLGGFAMLNNEGEAAVMSIVSQCFQKGKRPLASGIFEASEIPPTDLQTSPAP